MNCPACNKELIPSVGDEEYPILIVGNKPDKDKHFDGNTIRILVAELGKFGIDLRSCRKTNYWLHAPNSKTSCRKFMEKQLTEEAKGKKAILLLGAEPVSFFTDRKYGISEVSSLRIESETSFSAKVILASVHPSEAFRGGVGELKLAFKRFATALQEENIL